MNKKFDVSLPEEVAAVVEGAVASGQFESSDEMLADAVQTWTRHQERRAQIVATMRKRVEESLADPRPAVPIEDVFERIYAKIDENFKDR